MKVTLRQHTPDLIPIRRWIRNYEWHRGEILDDPFYDLEEGDDLDRAVYKILTTMERIFDPLNTWWSNFRDTKKVTVDYRDIWNAGETIAIVIVPVLKKLKEHKHGSPFVHREDVPEHLRPTEEPSDLNGWTDNTVHERWEWVLDEMIWAFEQELYDWESQYCHNSDQLDMGFVKKGDEPEGFTSITFNYQKDPTKPPYHRDREGIKAHQERIENGRRLFAKYYGGLWD